MGLNTRTQKDDVIKKDAVEAVMKKTAEVEETSAHTIQNSQSKKLDPPTPQIKNPSNTGKAPQVLLKDAVELVKLLKLDSVTKDANEIGRVSNALYEIALSDAGRQSCIAAGAPLALTDLAKEKTVKENGEAARYVADAYREIRG